MALDPVALAQWKANAEVDYLEYFRKAYEPINAWFKDVYGAGVSDSNAIAQIKNSPNVIRTEIVLLLGDTTSDAIRFREAVGLLHERLERQSGFPSATRGPITFRSCWIADNPQMIANTHYKGVQYTVERGNPSGNRILCEVRTRRGVIFSLHQRKYDVTVLRTHPQYATISPTQRAKLDGLYQAINPRLIKSLLDPMKRGPHIQAGTIRLRENPEELFAGLVEMIYCLRCVLLHGDIAPNTTHHEVYEPAYYILRRFLQCIT